MERSGRGWFFGFWGRIGGGDGGREGWGGGEEELGGVGGVG